MFSWVFKDFGRQITLGFFFARDRYADELYDFPDQTQLADMPSDPACGAQAWPGENTHQNNTSDCASSSYTRELTTHSGHS